jgi:U3 small nucleolar RNA-associated protein 25
MSTETELKLLTLLNVAAIKKPRELDIPGGQRGSPSIQGTSANNSAAGSPAAVPAPTANGTKKRKGVKFGGELGPSGSLFGKKAKQVENGKASASANMNGNGNGSGKGKGKEVNGSSNGESHAEKNGHLDIDVDEASDDETVGVTSEPFNRARKPRADYQAIDSMSILALLPTFSIVR